MDLRHRSPHAAPAPSSNASAEPPVNKKPLASALPSWLKLATLSLIYAAFGLFLQKGQVYLPQVIQGQFLFTDWRMMTMFLSAVCTTHLMYSLMSALSEVKKAKGQRSSSVFDRLLAKSSHICVDFCLAHEKCQKGHGERGWVAVALGASLLGAGMAIAGTCPGTINAQLGSEVFSLTSGNKEFQVPNVFAVLAGALVGGLVFLHLLQPVLVHGLFNWGKKGSAALHHGLSLHKTLHTSYHRLAVPLALAEALFVAVVCMYLPQSNPQPLINTEFLFSPKSSIIQKFFLLLTQPSWHPVYAGIGIGLLQVPSVLLLNAPLGSSSNILALWSILAIFIPGVRYLIPANQSEVARPKSTLYTNPSSAMSAVKMEKILAAFMCVLGAYISIAQQSASSNKTALDVMTSRSVLQSFFGGFVLLLGSRLAGGCTSGHGISGMGMLIWNSTVIAVPFMFASAILTMQLFL